MFGQQSDDNGIELQGAYQSTVANRHVDDSHQKFVAGLLLVALSLGFLQCRRQSGEFVLRNRQYDIVFGPELVVNSGFRDPDGVGDHLQRGSADAVPSEQIQRGI